LEGKNPKEQQMKRKRFSEEAIKGRLTDGRRNTAEWRSMRSNGCVAWRRRIGD
jgi:hypothetical protein